MPFKMLSYQHSGISTSSGAKLGFLRAVLHLARVKAVDPEYEILGRPSVTLEDIKSFRQFGSRCAGHPEYRWTSGVETTTGPRAV